MGKNAFWGAVALAMGLIVVNPCDSYAVQIENGVTKAAQEQRSLTTSVEDAEEALAYAKAHKSAEYPGLDSYLEKLITAAKADEVENETELVRALDEATAAVPFLTAKDEKVAKRDVKNTEAASVQTVTKKTAEKTAGTTGAAGTAGMAIKLMVQDDARTPANDEPTENGESAGNVEPAENVELPATGETESLGLGNFILVGAVVALATMGATLLIVKSKK